MATLYRGTLHGGIYQPIGTHTHTHTWAGVPGRPESVYIYPPIRTSRRLFWDAFSMVWPRPLMSSMADLLPGEETKKKWKKSYIRFPMKVWYPFSNAASRRKQPALREGQSELRGFGLTLPNIMHKSGKELRVLRGPWLCSSAYILSPASLYTWPKDHPSAFGLFEKEFCWSDEKSFVNVKEVKRRGEAKGEGLTYLWESNY